jgi:hypothetical protein
MRPAAFRRRIIYPPCPKLIYIHNNLSFRNSEIVKVLVLGVLDAVLMLHVIIQGYSTGFNACRLSP